MKLVVLYLGRLGAGPLYAYKFTKSLLDANVQVLSIISSYSSNLAVWKELAEEYKDSLTLMDIPTYNSKKEFIFSSLNIKQYIKLIDAIKKFGAEYVFTPMVHPWHNVILPFLPSSIKKIKVIHDTSVHKGERNAFSLLLNWCDIRVSDKLIVLTEYSKKRLEHKTDNPIFVIPHAEFNGYGSCKKNREKIQYRIGFFGRINKYKGLDVLLEAFSIVYKQQPHLRLMIAGNGDCSMYKDYFNRYQSVLDLNIRWIEDNEVTDLLSDVDFVVLPYIEASQSGVIPLAFALGKTVIVTDVGGLPEQVPKETGIIIPANRSDILAQEILKLYDNPKRIIELGKNAQNYAKENLSWESSAKKIIEILKL